MNSDQTVYHSEVEITEHNIGGSFADKVDMLKRNTVSSPMGLLDTLEILETIQDNVLTASLWEKRYLVETAGELVGLAISSLERIRKEIRDAAQDDGCYLK